MASISVYTDPGVYISEVIEPGSVSVVSERTLGIVAIAPRTRRVTDESVVRGKVYAETVTGWSLTTPFVASLVNTSNRDRNNAIMYANGNALGLGDWLFRPATIEGAAGTPVNINVNHFFTISLDGKKAITINLTPGAAVALTTVATEINAALVASPTYGAAYSAVATTFTTAAPNDTLRLTSPLSTSASDIKIFVSRELDCASVISNASWAPSATTGVQPNTNVQVIDTVYSSTATYTIEYVTVETVEDPLAECTTSSTLDNIIIVGSYPGSSSYVKDQDYEDGASTTIDWNVAAYYHAANVTSAVAGAYAVVGGVNDVLSFSLNGLTPINVTLTTGLPAPTAANVATDVNTALAASTVYGPEYSWSASDSGGKFKIEVRTPFQSFPVERGYETSIVFYTVSRNAFAAIFGAGVSLPYETRGAASRPAFGTSYYATYDYNRLSADYDVPVKVYSPTQLYDYCSPITITNYTRNKLAIAGEIAFENNAPALWLQQINDSTAPGTPTTTQIHTAIDNCEEKSGITDLVVIDSSLDTAVYLMTHVADQSSMINKHYRRGWFGMARGTDVGDPDTPDTFVYRATRTLQPGNTSPGRGRLILVAPSEATRTVTLEDGREVDVEVDGTYIATAVGALFTSLASPSDVLINKLITGFKIDDFETYIRGERHTLAGNGVCVVTQDSGKFILLDPLTTEAGGGKVVSFEEPSASAQKDAVTLTVDSLLYNNVVGVVPDDLADFITDVKKWIMLGILASINNGTIGPYKNSDGTTRDIDPKTDIVVYQSTTDQRTYYFKYWYNLRYPAKRFFGEYSVDNPFFSLS